MSVQLHGTSATWLPAADPNVSVATYPIDGKRFTPQELRTAVGGFTQIIRLPHWWLVIHDEGAVNGSPLNIVATRIAGVPIFGDVLLSPLPWID